MEHDLPPERLLAVIETQNEIAATALDLDAVMAIVVRRAQEIVDATAGVVELLEGEEMVYHVASGTASAHVGLRLRADASFSGLCVSRNEILYCEDTGDGDRVDRDACRRAGAVSMVCVPLRHDAHTVGVLKVYDPCPRAFDAADLHTLELLSGVIAAHMAHASAYQDEQHASGHDALTGLSNRRGFDDRLATEAARVRRHGDDLALCLLDLDGFKEINDALGHAAGDDVLRAMARHFTEVRGEDAAFRLGGDEFAFMLVGAGDADARAVAERINAAVREDPACRGVTISWGIALLTDNDPVGMIARADAALYQAKRAGQSEPVA
ncbi:MAG TPA: sensor domain-containing diguanylate cyclase [Solirubrobacteraceae bacterium]|nr:sensor domain-containing diguanylate cyclase [Solirubrobacteraceae bacterium]